jgi:hypothetical protein
MQVAAFYLARPAADSGAQRSVPQAGRRLVRPAHAPQRPIEVLLPDLRFGDHSVEMPAGRGAEVRQTPRAAPRSATSRSDRLPRCCPWRRAFRGVAIRTVLHGDQPGLDQGPVGCFRAHGREAERLLPRGR